MWGGSTFYGVSIPLFIHGKYTYLGVKYRNVVTKKAYWVFIVTCIIKFLIDKYTAIFYV